MLRGPTALLLLLAVVPAARAASPAKQACKPFDVGELRKVLRIPLEKPHGTGGASLLSCSAEGDKITVTLNHSPEPNTVLGSAGEFQKSVEAARAAGRVQVQEFKETRCAALQPSGGSKFARFKAFCVLHSKQGRYVSLEVLAPSEKKLPRLEQVRTAAEAAAGRVE